jgi:hypothetical protein
MDIQQFLVLALCFICYHLASSPAHHQLASHVVTAVHTTLVMTSHSKSVLSHDLPDPLQSIYIRSAWQINSVSCFVQP